jgi:hypothetical protein
MHRHEVIAGSSFLRLAFIDAFPKMTLSESLSRQCRAWSSVPQNRYRPESRRPDTIRISKYFFRFHRFRTVPVSNLRRRCARAAPAAPHLAATSHRGIRGCRIWRRATSNACLAASVLGYRFFGSLYIARRRSPTMPCVMPSFRMRLSIRPERPGASEVLRSDRPRSGRGGRSSLAQLSRSGRPGGEPAARSQKRSNHHADNIWALPAKGMLTHIQCSPTGPR